MRETKLQFLERAVLLCEPDKCAEWPFPRDNYGFGYVFVGRVGSNRLAHRHAWELVNGPIPRRLCVLQSCDNHACFNPHHLFIGTREWPTEEKNLYYLEKAVAICTPDVCCEWPFARRGDGYGCVCIKRKPIAAHRLAWELVNGPIPPGLFACHKCDNPPCFNPFHIFLGTSADNSRDMADKGRSTHGENHYRARLTEAQVREIRRKYAKRSLAAGELSAEYKTCSSNIHHIVSGKGWKHVDNGQQSGEK